MQTQRSNAAARKSGFGKVWLLAAVLAAGCGGGSEVALLVPFFTFGFEFKGPVGGANHDIFVNLNPNAPTTATGNFEEFSTLRIDNDSHDVTGTYAGCTMKLNLAPIAPATTVPAPLAASYDGRFTGPNTIELTPQGGSLPVLTVTRAQGQTDPRPQTC